MGGAARVGSHKLSSTSNFLLAPMRIPGIVVTVNSSTSSNNAAVEQGAVAGQGGEHYHTYTPQDLEWPTVEHYFQAAKFDVTTAAAAHCRRIQLAADPLDAWELGQSRDFPLRSNWEAIKGYVMYTAVRTKYAQHAVYADTLAHTMIEPIQAGPSTSNWQYLNTIVLERVRYELRVERNLPNLVQRHVYDAWCAQTNLPAGAAPIVVHVLTA